MVDKKHSRSLRGWVWIYVVVSLMAAIPVQADIYRYVDDKGTIHFSNAPISPKYELYIREVPGEQWGDTSSRYDAYITEAAHKYDVPFSLVKAIIRVESDFDPRAVSNSGACGLMQIMPQTAKDLGIIDAFDPRENILGGVRYLKGLLTRFHGSIPLALAAYNAGPNRVNPHREMPRIQETERFVQKVIKYFNHY